MYYRLSDDYRLCGWKSIPFAIRGPKEDYHYNREQYKFVLFCDGVTNVAEEELSTDQKALRDSLLESGMVISSKEILQGLLPLQQYIQYGVPYIKELTWGVTGKCNYLCRHCFMSAPKGIHPEPTWDMCIHVLDELKSCGIRDLILTGGEPFFRKDIPQLLSEMKKRDIRVTAVLSNGSLITDRILGAFEENDMHPFFAISFDGINYHDQLRGIPGAKTAATKAIEKITEHGNKVRCNMCLDRNNAGELRDTVNFLDALGVSSILVSATYEQGLWQELEKRYSLSLKEQLNILLDYIPYFYKDRVKADFDFQGWFTAKGYEGEYHSGNSVKYEKDTDLSGKSLCMSPRHKAYLNSEGMLSPCVAVDGNKSEKEYVSIYEQSLKELLSDSLWTEFNQFTIEDYLRANEKCRGCEFNCECGFGCPGFGLTDHGHLLGIDEKNCSFVKNRYAQRILEVACAARSASGN